MATGTFTTAEDLTNVLLLRPGQEATYSLTESAPGTWVVKLEETTNPTSSWIPTLSYIDNVSSAVILNDSKSDKYYRLRCDSIAVVTIDWSFSESTGEVQGEIKNPLTGVAEITFTDNGLTVERNLQIDGNLNVTGTSTSTGSTFTTPALVAATVTAQATDATIGTVAAPAAGTTSVTIAKIGNFFVLTFTLTAARISVTDAGASGAYGATKIFDFVQGGVSFLGCRQNYTAYTPDGTGVPTDDEFVIGVGTTAITAAADATLAAGEQNVGASISQTLVAGTTTGTGFTAANSAFDGTATAADLYLNYSGDDVTTDGNGTIDVTGTITVVGVFLGDD